MFSHTVQKRDLRIAPFDISRIRNAISKASIAAGIETKEYAEQLASRVLEQIERDFTDSTLAISVETIQDVVEEVLLKSGEVKVARHYISYRERRRLQREELFLHTSENSRFRQIFIQEENGEKSLLNIMDVKKILDLVMEGLEHPEKKIDTIMTELERSIHDGIKRDEIAQLLINIALENIKEDFEYDAVATRLLLHEQYKKILGSYSSHEELLAKHVTQFPEYIRRAVSEDLLVRDMGKLFDLERLATELVVSRDSLFKYIGLHTAMNRYMIRFRSQNQPCEVPQFFWMRVAMGFSLNESDPTAGAIRIYHKISRLEYLPAGSSLIHAGTITPRLSNCFVAEMQDSIDHIGKTVSDIMKLTKATGGIGLSVTRLRAEGSPIKQTNTFSSGPVPFMHVIDSAIRAVSRAGKKLGALCFYMENWHLNFEQFLDLKQNAGDEYRRTRTANTATFISDEFMTRVEQNDDWYLFDPAETPDLVDLYGAAFSKRYREYVTAAEAGEIRAFKKIKAREQFKAMLISLQTTAHPWLTWKDAINTRALNNNTGTIHLSNLCTEICLPQDVNNIAVCNLASINLAQHITSNNELDWNRLEQSVRVAVRQLDNLVDITISPVEEATSANQENRAVGLGIMGYTEILEKKELRYDSEDSYEYIDNIMEFISYIAIDESAQLAQERGSYKNFATSRWAKGYVPFDTLDETERERGQELTVSRVARMNWDVLREKVQKGMRNATLLAIAPTASIGLVAGTTTGIDPRFAQVFSRATSRGKFLELNDTLVHDLQKRGLWEDIKNVLVENYGDLSHIDGVPQEMKDIYKTSFSISPTAFIEVAARAQKWVDQAISRNMYLETRDIDEITDIYMHAWKKGLKTTYYLHMKPRHSAEQSTTKVNKSSQMGKRGFGFSAASSLSVPEPQETVSLPIAKQSTTNTCPVDPQDRLQCESCQ